MIFKKFSYTVFIIIFANACLFSGGDVDPTPSKAEIRERANNGDQTDYCEMFDWYFDGTCDDFCINEDGDCNSCGIQPSCPEETPHPVGSCNEEDPKCKKVTQCGQTIYCEVLIPCPSVRVENPCAENYTYSEVCDTSDPENPCIEVSTRCDGPGFCNYNPVACLAVETQCPVAYFAVEECKLADLDCIEVEGCDQSIFCTPDLDCEAAAACGEDEILFASGFDCDSAATNCRQEYLCGGVIWCGGLDTCARPTCDGGRELGICTDPGMCEEVFGCGQRIFCEK